VKKIEPSMLFVHLSHGLQPRTISVIKLSVFEEGMPITLELDEANVVIDIHRGH